MNYSENSQKNLLIFGIKENRNEDIEKTVISIINTKMKMDIGDHEIGRCHQVGQGITRCFFLKIISSHLSVDYV